MEPHSAQLRDPVVWCGAICAGFAVLLFVRLGVPSTPYFDETHYVPAARALLEGNSYPNREHPMLGKELIAAGIAIFGDRSFGWRIFPALFGVLTLFAAMRALWFASLSRIAVLCYGVLLATGFHLFIHARIAMLDIFMVSFCTIAAWQFAAAVREPEMGRRRLALTGIAIGLAMASKWNAIPLAVLPGLAFLLARVRATGWRAAWTFRGAPVPGISLGEAALWLGVVPLIVYWLTFAPVYASGYPGLAEYGFIGLQREMLELQGNVLKPHPYQSNWPDWLLNIRAIWYLYEPIDGAQRGVLLIGNPLTMLLGLPALLWAAWVALKERRVDALAVLLIFLASFGLWLFANKPVQFYYHYFLPSCALLAALALMVDRLWEQDWRIFAAAIPVGSIAIFAWFYPILSSAPLDGPGAFETWMWLDSWR